MKAIIDFDPLVFEAACLAEDRSILVTNKHNGEQRSFKNRTDFYGYYKTKSGGWLAQHNLENGTALTAEDFDIEDVQESLGMGIAQNVIKTRLESILEKVGTTDYIGFVTKGKSFREDISTVLKYKGNRDKMLTPLHRKDVMSLLVRKYNVEYQEHFEVDDRVVVEWHKDKESVVVGFEKDYMGCEINFFNPDIMDEPMQIRGLGGLWIDGNKQVKGYGRKWLYFQIASSDLADNYSANSASDVKWGPKSAYQTLSPCQSDKECFEAMRNIYMKLYPSPKKIVGWRGDEIEIDWLYMLNENFQLARMRRWENDEFHVTTVLDKLQVKY